MAVRERSPLPTHIPTPLPHEPLPLLQLLEAALCLALQHKELEARPELRRGGVLTPASAMGVLLIERLRAAGMTFDVLDA